MPWITRIIPKRINVKCEVTLLCIFKNQMFLFSPTLYFVTLSNDISKSSFQHSLSYHNRKGEKDSPGYGKNSSDFINATIRTDDTVNLSSRRWHLLPVPRTTTQPHFYWESLLGSWMSHRRCQRCLRGWIYI